MPRRQVYGKRANAKLCSTVTKFNASSSPTRRQSADDEVEAIACGLQNVTIKDTHDTTYPTPKRARKALSPRERKGVIAEQPARQKQHRRRTKDIKEKDQESEDVPSLDLPSTSTPEDNLDSSGPLKETKRAQRHDRSLVTPVSPITDYPPRYDSPELSDSTEGSGESEDSDVSERIHPDALYTWPLLQLCRDPHGRKSPVPFSTWSASLEEHLKISKIAEASYGEVYRLAVNGPSSINRSEESVLKVIALKPDKLEENSELTEEEKDAYQWMSTIPSVASEVHALLRMASTPGFTNFRELRVVQGRPTKFFSKAWKEFNKAQPRGKKSLFPDPAKKASYGDDQLWAIIEMQDACQDLEHLEIDHVWALWDVFWGVTLAVAKAEESARFEHRDLHLGNICVRSRDSDTIDTSLRTYHGKLNFTNLETTIIDYTLSRAELKDSDVAYLDLDADPAVFEGNGDDDYQYDIYRYMRSTFFYNDPNAPHGHPSDSPKPRRKNRTWRDYNPMTNVIWLHFILHSLLWKLSPDEDVEVQPGKNAKADRRAAHSRKKEAQLRRRLVRLDKTLDFRRADQTEDQKFERAGELVEWAVESGWLNESDVLGDTRLVQRSQEEK